MNYIKLDGFFYSKQEGKPLRAIIAPKEQRLAAVMIAKNKNK